MGCTASSVVDGTCTPEAIRSEREQIQALLDIIDDADPKTRDSLTERLYIYYNTVMVPRTNEIIKLNIKNIEPSSLTPDEQARLTALKTESAKNAHFYNKLITLQSNRVKNAVKSLTVSNAQLAEYIKEHGGSAGSADIKSNSNAELAKFMAKNNSNHVPHSGTGLRKSRKQRQRKTRKYRK